MDDLWDRLRQAFDQVEQGSYEEVKLTDPDYWIKVYRGAHREGNTYIRIDFRMKEDDE